MADSPEFESVTERGASAILNAFEHYHTGFKAITRRARSRFETQDWHGAQKDALERLDLYALIIQVIVAEIRSILGEKVWDQSIWGGMKGIYSRAIASRDDFELAETFFNSVTRRIFSTVGVASNIEFVDSDFEAPASQVGKPISRVYHRPGPPHEWVKRVLVDYEFSLDYHNLDRDSALVSKVIEQVLYDRWGLQEIAAVEMLKPVFYRGKGAYLIGRILFGQSLQPLLIALLNNDRGLNVDAVLLSEDEISIVFSFTRSYFHVEAEIPHQLIGFLKSILPHKRIAELYISIGYNKHGKTELYRDLLRHLRTTDDRFGIARGEKGMVMTVFTMPSYDMVFKVIKDRFGEPKTTTRQEVMDRYQLVFKHDRAGRLIDAQEFEHLKIDCDRFSDNLLKELQAEAAGSVTMNDKYVAIKHLYMERRTTPLDVFVREAESAAVKEAIIDYGQALKDLAATNIFPGDILIKNFGVTRHGRVVFYDYDELVLLTECTFRRIPQAREFSDDFESEPWFFVGKNDIFPQEFRTFLGLPDPYRSLFEDAHGDLFEAKFWKNMQKRHKSGEVIDIFPYRQERHLAGNF